MSDLRVLLIGGPPGAGKTTLARAVGAKLGHGSLTADDLVVAGRVLTTPETHPALHPMRPTGHVRYFTESHPDQLITGSRSRVTELLSRGVTRIQAGY